MNNENLLGFGASYLKAFLIGVMCREIYTFISQGGLSGDFPLSRSLFVIIMCMITLALLAFPSMMREILTESGKIITEINQSPAVK
jgi:hypothetical protein